MDTTKIPRIPRRAWLAALIAASAVASIFAGYLGMRGGHWDEVFLAGLCAALATVAAFTAASIQYRRGLSSLGQHLAQFRQNPAPASLSTALPEFEEELGPLVESVESLRSAYRQALADRVDQDQALDSLRQVLDTDKGRVSVRSSGSSRNMVARLTPNLFWMTATPALAEFLNRKATHLNGRPFAEVVHTQDLANVEIVFHEALETGEAHNIMLRLVPRGKRKAGARAARERYVTMDVLTRFTEDGQPLHFRCSFVDVTARVRAEQKLRRRTRELSLTNERLRRINEDLERLKESYRDLYHHAPVMYFSLDAQGHFVTFNETLLRALGYRRDDLWKQPYRRLLPPPSRETLQYTAHQSGNSIVEPAFPHALTQEGEVETQWMKKNGTTIDVWIRSVPVQDEAGKFVRSRSAAQDMTERNRLANELRSRRDELERTNSELRLINRELEEFTSVVSHDLKEPLRTLQAFSNFLAEDYSGQLGPDGFQYINHLVQASRRLGTLIDDLLKLSSAGRIMQELESFNLIETVAAVRRDLVDLVQRQEADLVVEGSLPRVQGDPRRVTQLLANLVGNGLKYNRSPRPQVIIGAVPEPAAKRKTAVKSGKGRASADQVTLYVRDNGIGIEPRYHEQIFGIFRRLHQPEEYEGTGAGLAICKKIVEAHGGRIWVDSEPGVGSTFYFTLPRAQDEDLGRHDTETGKHQDVKSDTASATPISVQETAEGRLCADTDDMPALGSDSRPNLLLVDDMPEIGLIVQKLGERAGYRITWLRTAEEAWDLLQGARPELLLLDVHLPGMSGIELCRRLRQQPNLEDLPVALFTQGNEDAALLRQTGAQFVLSKDLLCQPDSWLQRLEEMLHACARP
jgi:PAS domain S-box-containing protein